jgi:putative ABC transport system substrate-binding protein
MKRRDFVLLLGGAALCLNAARAEQTPLIAQHSTTKKRMALVSPSSKPEGPKDFARIAFQDEMKRLGFVEGDNLIVEEYWAEGLSARYDSLVREVVATMPDAIFAMGGPLTLRFKAATNTIPIVAVTGDPIRQGIVSSLARPGGNVTGVSVDAGPEIWAKRLEILAEAVPKLVNVVYIATLNNLSSFFGKATQEAAQNLGISLVNAPVSSPANEAEYRRVFDSIQRDSVDGILFSAEFQHMGHRFLLAQLVQQLRLPAMHDSAIYVEAGGLMSYAVDLNEAMRTMAKKVAEILKGTNPGDLPYVQGVRFELAINLKTAKAIGIEFPATFLARADRMIE